jgi:hypothetical protein
MVSKTFSILFYFKTGKTSAKGTLPIYMRITIDGQRVELSTKREWTPGRWPVVAGRATGTKEDAKSINAYLDTLQVKVHEEGGSEGFSNTAGIRHFGNERICCSEANNSS